MSIVNKKTPFEQWHYTHGENTQGIPWVDTLVKAAWDAGHKSALDKCVTLAADAARYRFITAHIADEGDMDVLERAFESLGDSETCTQAEFNACIDAAIVKEQRQAGVQ